MQKNYLIINPNVLIKGKQTSFPLPLMLYTAWGLREISFYKVKVVLSDNKSTVAQFSAKSYLTLAIEYTRPYLWAWNCLPVNSERICHLSRQGSLSFEVCPEKN